MSPRIILRTVGYLRHFWFTSIYKHSVVGCPCFIASYWTAETSSFNDSLINSLSSKCFRIIVSCHPLVNWWVWSRLNRRTYKSFNSGWTDTKLPNSSKWQQCQMRFKWLKRECLADYKGLLLTSRKRNVSFIHCSCHKVARTTVSTPT